MNKTELSKKKLLVHSIEDIPEALRETTIIKTTRSRLRLVFVIGGLLGLGAITLGFGFWYVTSTPLKNVAPAPSPAISPSPQVAQSVPINPSASNSETLLGHFAYSEAPVTELQPLVSHTQIRLRQPAAEQFQAMMAAARAVGVVLVPISGFRSATAQEHLFFDVKAQRGQVATKRAEVSAPPGYSEHHTGYAVDIGDGKVPATNLNITFEQTKAYKWLIDNAARFSFELSFPKDNAQGVSYEPWHWRYVGDRHSLETFYKAKNLPPRTTAE